MCLSTSQERRSGTNMKTVLLFARTQLVRVSRDVVTLIVLFSIPAILLIVFGAFTTNTDNVSLRVAIVNQSESTFAKEFEKQLDGVKILKQPDGELSQKDTEEKIKAGELDAAVILPGNFGDIKNNMPSGEAKVYVNQASLSTGDIVMGVMNQIIDQTNVAITGSQPPVSVSRATVDGQSSRVFDNLYAMFTAMGIMMVGIFGVASAIPADKKTGMLRRLRVTPLRASQLVLGTSLAYLVIAIASVVLMSALAVLVFGMTMHGSWLDFSIFVLVASSVMIAFGVLVGGIAKNTTQSDIYGQIIFLVSLAFSGLWVPRALMPEWLQGITAYLPLTPIIEGLQRIVIEGATLASLGFQLAVLVGWFVIVTLISVRTFRWE